MHQPGAMKSVSSCCGRHASNNVLDLLHKRQITQYSWGGTCQLTSVLNTRSICLDEIVTESSLREHVILGFTQTGSHLISYKCHSEVYTYTYSLHWWLFDLKGSLKHVCERQLFCGEEIDLYLQLVVCQTPDGRHVVVMGCRRSYAEDRRVCYVTVTPAPGESGGTTAATDLHLPCRVWQRALDVDRDMVAGCSVHFKFDLLPPFPAFIPSLCLRVSGHVIVNTGDSLVVLRFSDGGGRSDEKHNITTHSSHSSHSRQIFGFLPSETSSQVSNSPSSSPNSLLPVEVYCNRDRLVDVSMVEEKPAKQVAIAQTSLELEVWLNEVLQLALKDKGFRLYSLVDYDIQLAEVCGDRGDVVFVVVAVLNASECSSSCTMAEVYSTEIIANWNMYSGTACALRFTELKPTPWMELKFSSQAPHSVWNPAAHRALELRKRWYLHTSPQYTIIAFSNRTVFTGKSLHSLRHPHLPVAIVLSPNRS